MENNNYRKVEIDNLFKVLSNDIDDCIDRGNISEVAKAHETLEELHGYFELLQKELDEYREALEWLSQHLRQESVTKDVIRGILDAALSKAKIG